MDPESFFHVAIKVDHLEDSLAFYQEFFSANVVDRGIAANGDGTTAVNHVALTVADKRVYLFDQAPYEAAGLRENVPTGFLHFGFVVNDIDRAFRELSNAGVEFIMEPSGFGELTIAFFTDPDGTCIELIEER